ncbi:MAG: efflux RND transporter periplasmic adaptor subunit [Prevotellaceae bacterium]|jgi:multidrug efflux pump subunit AcrA (membrane-fusion protein)|nr:efflux RND transporter periplasmic adaptor subunit [Prevotellaceae bacterium]
MMKKREIILYSFALLLFIASCNPTGESKADHKRGLNGATIIETGTLEAINNVLFILPRYSLYWYQMRIIGILENGTLVNKGDSIIQIDPSEVNRFIIERETNLETQRANLQKMEVTQSNQISDLESRIRSEEAAFDLKKIELESSVFDTERNRAIKKLEFSQAELLLSKERRKLTLAKIINSNDLKIQRIRIRQLEDDLKHFSKILPTLTVQSTVAGVFQRGENPYTGKTINTGDQMYPGFPMGNVPELEWMKVNTFINENDFLKVNVGQRVTVRLDALPDLKFNGEVTYVGKLCITRETNSKQKGFEVEVKLLDSDERLKPGMTVSCEFLSN